MFRKSPPSLRPHLALLTVVGEKKINNWCKGLVTHNDILKIYGIIQYSKNIFKCNMVKNINKIYKKIALLLKK